MTGGWGEWCWEEGLQFDCIVDSFFVPIFILLAIFEESACWEAWISRERAQSKYGSCARFCDDDSRSAANFTFSNRRILFRRRMNRHRGRKARGSAP